MWPWPATARQPFDLPWLEIMTCRPLTPSNRAIKEPVGGTRANRRVPSALAKPLSGSAGRECCSGSGIQMEIDDDGRVVGRRAALARVAVDVGVDHLRGQHPAEQHQVDAHALALVEHAGAVVPVREGPPFE